MTQNNPPKKSSFIQKHLIFALTLTSVLVFIGFGVSFFAIQIAMEDKPGGPIKLFARVIEDLSDKVPLEEIFKTFSEEDPNLSPFSLLLLDENGALLATANRKNADNTPRILNGIKKKLPQEVGQIERLGKLSLTTPYASQIIRLNLNPARYLVVIPKRRTGPQKHTMNIVMGFVLASALIATLFSFTILLRHMRKNANIIEEVMASIRSGNLKARFPVRKLDEVGHLMHKFNEMADEIESLVSRVRKNEQIRANILQELGHDLRTPITSLKNSLETLTSRELKLNDEQREKLFDLALKEVEYISPLVDNLLLLASIDDPRFVKKANAIPVANFLDAELHIFKNKIQQQKLGKEITFENALPDNFTLKGDEFLLQRLTRNLVENAVKFAHRNIRVKAAVENSRLVLAIQDDGPGLSSEMLNNYGERKSSRMFDESTQGKISLGLGSVIVKAIANYHGANVKVENLASPESGALIRVYF